MNIDFKTFKELDMEYRKGLKPFRVLKDLEHDKEGDVVFLTPEFNTTTILITKKIISPEVVENE